MGNWCASSRKAADLDRRDQRIPRRHQQDRRAQQGAGDPDGAARPVGPLAQPQPGQRRGTRLPQGPAVAPVAGGGASGGAGGGDAGAPAAGRARPARGSSVMRTPSANCLHWTESTRGVSGRYHSSRNIGTGSGGCATASRLAAGIWRSSHNTMEPGKITMEVLLSIYVNFTCRALPTTSAAVNELLTWRTTVCFTVFLEWIAEPKILPAELATYNSLQKAQA
jgi:hypothetical protein